MLALNFYVSAGPNQFSKENNGLKSLEMDKLEWKTVL